ncbi:MAG TPA: response regulator transcription factor [Mycobacteriales bacterium]|nr:response regulator transcription factor [Mycobacteriales bacterium]
MLLVEDSETERAFITQRLLAAGYEVLGAANGREAMRTLFRSRPDIVVLDVVMPELDGWRTLEQIRDASEVPVIMLTQRNTEIERIRGLRHGADDYVGKPYSPAELMARIDAVLRRTGTGSEVREVWDDGEVRIDFDSHTVTVRGTHVELTPLEFRLLVVLTENAGRVLTHDRLLDLVWGSPGAVIKDQVKLYVAYLRRKVEADPSAPRLIVNVRGVGYRYRRPGV